MSEEFLPTYLDLQHLENIHPQSNSESNHALAQDEKSPEMALIQGSYLSKKYELTSRDYLMSRL
jgi:hypothetical protein